MQNLTAKLAWNYKFGNFDDFPKLGLVGLATLESRQLGSTLSLWPPPLQIQTIHRRIQIKKANKKTNTSTKTKSKTK